MELRCDGRSEVHLLKRSQGLLCTTYGYHSRGWAYKLEAPRPAVLLNFSKQSRWCPIPPIPLGAKVPSGCLFHFFLLDVVCCCLFCYLSPPLCLYAWAKKKNYQGPLSKSKGLCCMQYYSQLRTCNLFPSSINTTVISGML